ncbi:hypothetical protein GUJ93_ZPchr0009g1491 [Zizania palustris]|uniref:Uncharacterized protein n=1 Tax=Zizania palustris TaxID=103762 RepID=A0A8J5RSD8_ZIZPA|nr:hypothetical protein GUJ93_ZPchr0009g1491 [Zizania palustris]
MLPRLPARPRAPVPPPHPLGSRALAPSPPVLRPAPSRFASAAPRARCSSPRLPSIHVVRSAGAEMTGGDHGG